MDDKQALNIIGALSKGIDPTTGEILPDSSIIRHADTASALKNAVATIEKQIASKDRRGKLPCRAGKPWSATEDKQISEAYDQGKTVAEISKEYGRTKGAIKARLVKLGKNAYLVYSEDGNTAKNSFNETSLSAGEDITVPTVVKPQTSGKKCSRCGEVISVERIKAIPNAKTCSPCQDKIEKNNPEIVKRKIVENSLAGSREDHKKMRSNQWRDMQQRNRGN